MSRVRCLLGVLVALLIVGLSGVGAAPASARTCAPIEANNVVHQGTWNGAEVDCFTIEVPARADGALRLMLFQLAGEGGKLIVLNAARRAECSANPVPGTTSHALARCFLAAGTYTVDTRYGGTGSKTAVRPYELAVQDSLDPKGCTDFGRVTTQTLGLTLPASGVACWTIRVSGRGVILTRARFGNPTPSIVDGTRQRCDSAQIFNGACGLMPGTYRLLVHHDPWFDNSGTPITFTTAPPSSCQTVFPPDVSTDGRHYLTGTYEGNAVDCVRFVGYAGLTVYTSVITDGPLGAGRRIRRADGTILCTVTSRMPVGCRIDRTATYTLETWYRPAPSNGERHPYKLALQVPQLGANCPVVDAPGSWAGRRAKTGSAVDCRALHVGTGGMVLERVAGAPTISVSTWSSKRTICADVSVPCRLPAGDYAVIIGGKHGHWRFAVHTPDATTPSTCTKATSVPTAFDDAPLTQTWAGSEHDCVRFQGTAGHYVSASLAWTGSGRPAKRLIAADGRQICRSGAWAPLFCKLPTTGTYYLESWRQPALTDAPPTTYRIDLKDIRFAGVGPSIGCDQRNAEAGVVVEGRRANITDQVTCFEINNHVSSNHYRSWRLKTTPGSSAITVLDGAGRTICKNAATTTCTRSGAGYLIVSGRAGNYSFTLEPVPDGQ